MNTQKLVTLQAMRFFAALCVLQVHLWQNYLGISVGLPGTDFFLVLVGVVTAYSQARFVSQKSWWWYISARYKRLYVTFIPLFLITLFIKRAEADPSWVWKSFLFIPMQDRLPVIGSTWMISMFLVFYLIFSFCFLFKTEKIIWGIFGVWIALIISYNFFGLDTVIPQQWENLFFNERNIEFIFGFVVGLVLRQGWLQRRPARAVLWAGMLGTAAGLIALNSGYYTAGRSLFVGVPVAFFILGLGALERERVDLGIVRRLSKPWLVWLGGTSYVLYLSHGMFLQAWSRVLPISAIWVLPMTLGAVAVGAIGYTYWEKPVLLYLKLGKWNMHQLPFIHIRMEDKEPTPGN